MAASDVHFVVKSGVAVAGAQFHAVASGMVGQAALEEPAPGVVASDKVEHDMAGTRLLPGCLRIG